MSHPIGWGRLEARKHGVELPPLTSEIGIGASMLWFEAYRRERDIQLEFLSNFLPGALYVMSGVDPTVPMEARQKAMEPLRKTLYDSILERRYTVESRLENLEQERADLLDTIESMDRIDWITSDAFNLDEWFQGR